MPTNKITYKGDEEVECFYCSLPIEHGQQVYENNGSYCHEECFQRLPVEEIDNG
jgi:hypothetical protein